MVGGGGRASGNSRGEGGTNKERGDGRGDGVYERSFLLRPYDSCLEPRNMEDATVHGPEEPQVTEWRVLTSRKGGSRGNAS